MLKNRLPHIIFVVSFSQQVVHTTLRYAMGIFTFGMTFIVVLIFFIRQINFVSVPRNINCLPNILPRLQFWSVYTKMKSGHKADPWLQSWSLITKLASGHKFDYWLLSWPLVTKLTTSHQVAPYDDYPLSLAGTLSRVVRKCCQIFVRFCVNESMVRASIWINARSEPTVLLQNILKYS